MTKLFVIAGHGAGDPGACANGYCEADCVRELARKIKEYGGDSVKLGDFSRNYYEDSGIMRLTLPLDTQILELHLDSFSNPDAHGGHVIIYPGYEPDSYDKALAAFITDFFPGRSQAITKQQLGNADRAAARGYGYRLLECCFITNEPDIVVFMSHLDHVAQGILQAFNINANANPAPAPEPTPTPTPNTGENFGGTYRCMVDVLNVREGASISTPVITWYSKGQTVVLDDWYVINDGYVWGRYTGAQSGKKRYVAVGKPTGGYDPSDFLVKI